MSKPKDRLRKYTGFNECLCETRVIELYTISTNFYVYRFKLSDEWIAMDSSRLRLPVRYQFKEGEPCLARWTDSRKFKATVLKPLEDSKNLSIQL